MLRGRGFSLIELIVVVALASILAALGVLAHQAVRPGLNLSMAARQVVMDLKVARMQAIARNTAQRVVFTSGGSRYQPQRKMGASYIDEGAAVELPSGIVVMDCNAAGSAIGFRPRGNAGTFGTVTIANARGEVRRVIVDIAGQVRVQ
jgi:prepilin-type N-terminal cleavage/methylation domain-containing protein